MSMNRLVLVLNASYEAITTCTARRAITMVMKGKALVEKTSGTVIRTSQITVPVPAVIRLREYRRVPRAKRSMSRKGIMLRDGNVCQYCKRRYQSGDLTLDHVMPKSRGGASTWENLATSCKPCNNRKGDKTPSEAGMELLRQPRSIGIHAKHRLMAGDDKIWDEYLFV